MTLIMTIAGVIALVALVVMVILAAFVEGDD